MGALLHPLVTSSTIKRVSSEYRISVHKLSCSHLPSPSAYMGYPFSPFSAMGCTYARALHYDYYPTHFGLQSLGVTEPMFMVLTLLHYITSPCIPPHPPIWVHASHPPSWVRVSSPYPPYFALQFRRHFGGHVSQACQVPRCAPPGAPGLACFLPNFPAIPAAALGSAAIQAADPPQRANPFRYMRKPG
jgi:hypothetical protein